MRHVTSTSIGMADAGVARTSTRLVRATLHYRDPAQTTREAPTGYTSLFLTRQPCLIPRGSLPPVTPEHYFRAPPARGARGQRCGPDEHMVHPGHTLLRPHPSRVKQTKVARNDQLSDYLRVGQTEPGAHSLPSSEFAALHPGSGGIDAEGLVWPGQAKSRFQATQVLVSTRAARERSWTQTACYLRVSQAGPTQESTIRADRSRTANTRVARTNNRHPGHAVPSLIHRA